MLFSTVTACSSSCLKASSTVISRREMCAVSICRAIAHRAISSPGPYRTRLSGSVPSARYSPGSQSCPPRSPRSVRNPRCLLWSPRQPRPARARPFPRNSPPPRSSPRRTGQATRGRRFSSDSRILRFEIGEFESPTFRERVDFAVPRFLLFPHFRCRTRQASCPTRSACPKRPTPAMWKKTQKSVSETRRLEPR